MYCCISRDCCCLEKHMHLSFYRLCIAIGHTLMLQQKWKKMKCQIKKCGTNIKFEFSVMQVLTGSGTNTVTCLSWLYTVKNLVQYCINIINVVNTQILTRKPTGGQNKQRKPLILSLIPTQTPLIRREEGQQKVV